MIWKPGNSTPLCEKDPTVTREQKKQDLHKLWETRAIKFIVTAQYTENLNQIDHEQKVILPVYVDTDIQFSMNKHMLRLPLTIYPQGNSVLPEEKEINIDVWNADPGTLYGVIKNTQYNRRQVSELVSRGGQLYVAGQFTPTNSYLRMRTATKHNPKDDYSLENVLFFDKHYFRKG